MEPKYYTNERSQQILLSVLKANGIKKVVASPGTTNVTLVGSMQNDPWFEIYSSVDERSAAYIACGLAAETGEAVVITCTGATASRNYLPGLTEAFYRKLPVIAITANQGNYKAGHLIPQNIDRSTVLNDICKVSVQIEKTIDAEDEWKNNVLINKAILEAFRHGGGPVHINISTSYSRDFSVKDLPYTRIIRRYTAFDALPPIESQKIGIFIGSHKVFTVSEAKAIDTFCATYDAIVLHDHTSGYNGPYGVNFTIMGGQLKLNSPLAQFDLIIHIGEVSGDYYGSLICAKEVWRVSEDGELRDTFRSLSNIFEMPENVFFNMYSKEGSDNHTLHDSYSQIYQKCLEDLPELPFSNAWIAKNSIPMLPTNSVVHFGILNTLRSWNWFNLPSNVSTNSNVGGFGIDGCMSTLIGASLADNNKLYYAFLGDLAFFYDINVLGNRHVGNNVRIMLINNGRGAEFRLFTHACYQWGDRADPYMAAAGHYGSQNVNLVRDYAQNLGYEYLSANSKEEFLKNAQYFFRNEIGPSPLVFEVFTCKDNESDALRKIQNLYEPSSKEIAVIKVKENVKKIVPTNILNYISKIKANFRK